MRTAFINTISELAERDKDVCLVTGDLGFSVFENFIDRFPDQYLNVGVAEQNLVGLAAGLALLGKKPFVYSISTFISMRPYEQIRNDVCYQNLPVVLIGVGSTFSYSTFGCTHFPLEDLAIMRVLPNMRVTCPGDPKEVEMLLRQLYEKPGPAYMRIAKKGEPLINRSNKKITLGNFSKISPGRDVTIISTGCLLPNVVAAQEFLRKEGIRARVLSAHTIKPLDERSIVAAARETKAIIVCEEHSVLGGLAGAIAEVMVKFGVSIPVRTLGVPDEFPKGVGSQDYFLQRYSLTPEGIAKTAKAVFQS